MKHTAFGESLMTNIALGFTLCYISHSTLTLSYVFHKTSESALNNTYRAVCFITGCTTIQICRTARHLAVLVMHLLNKALFLL